MGEPGLLGEPVHGGGGVAPPTDIGIAGLTNLSELR